MFTRRKIEPQPHPQPLEKKSRLERLMNLFTRKNKVGLSTESSTESSTGPVSPSDISLTPPVSPSTSIDTSSIDISSIDTPSLTPVSNKYVPDNVDDYADDDGAFAKQPIKKKPVTHPLSTISQSNPSDVLFGSGVPDYLRPNSATPTKQVTKLSIGNTPNNKTQKKRQPSPYHGIGFSPEEQRKQAELHRKLREDQYRTGNSSHIAIPLHNKTLKKRESTANTGKGFSSQKEIYLKNQMEQYKNVGSFYGGGKRKSKKNKKHRMKKLKNKISRPY